MARSALWIVAVAALLMEPSRKACAQDVTSPARHGVEGGIIAGLNFSQVDGDGHHGFHAPGLCTGVWVARQFGQSPWGLRMELRYSGKGSRSVGIFNGTQDVRGTRYQLTLHYLELPIFAEYRFLNQLAANVGVAFGYLLQWNEQNAYGSFDRSTRMPPRRYEVSLQIAFGWRFHRHVGARGGFAYSIAPMRGIPDRVMGQRLGEYNNTLYLVLEYRI